MTNQRMKNQNLGIFEHGEFKDVEGLPMDEISTCMNTLAKLQNRIGKLDMNSFMNMYHDGITGQMLGFDQVNVGKHGMDCKAGVPLYLEVKSVSWNGGPLSQRFAAFNDIGSDKVESMKDKKVWLAVGVWFDINDLGFIIWGQNREIGNVLENKMNECKAGTRCSVNISLSSLITKYGFKIIAVSKNKEEVAEILSDINTKIDGDLKKKIINIEDFELETQSLYNKKVFLEYKQAKESEFVNEYIYCVE